MGFVIDHLLASRVYPLNKSKSKFVVAGLARRDADTWQPKVVLCNQYWGGIRLTVQEWREFVRRGNRFRDFLTDGEDENGAEITPYFSVSTKVVYKQPALVLETVDGKDHADNIAVDF